MIVDLDVVEATRKAFEPARLTSVGLSSRPRQLDAALWFAEGMTSDVVRKPELNLGQMAAGFGKTLAYLIPLIFMIQKTGKRGLVSTYTMHLRGQLLQEVQDVANELCRSVLVSMGLPFAPCSVAARQSLLNVASYEAARGVLEDAKRKGDLDETNIAQAYHDFVLDHYRNETLPRLGDWLICNESLPGNLVSGYGLTRLEQFLSDELDPEILDVISPAIKKHREEQQIIIDGEPDITVITHAMLMVNNLTFGQILGSDKTKRTIGAVVIDEADLIPNAALQWTTNVFDLENVAYLKTQFSHLEKTRPSKQGKAAINALHQRIKSVKSVIDNQHQLNGAEDYVIHQKESEAEKKALANAVLGLLEPIRNFFALYSDVMSYDTVSMCDRVGNSISLISSIYDDETKSGMDAALVEHTATKLLTRRYSAMGRKTKSYMIESHPTRSGWLPNRAWRNVNVHTFERFFFISATLDAQLDKTSSSFDVFQRRVGINPKFDNIRSRIVVPAPHHGTLSRLVMLNPDLIDTHHPGKHADRHAELVAWAIHEAQRRGGTTLVLFPSNDLRQKVFGILTRLGVDKTTVTIPPLGAPAEKSIRSFNQQSGIWMGHNWYGVNFVFNGRTLFQRVMIVKAPVSPANELRLAEFPHSTFRDIFEDCAAKIVQGLGRVIRFMFDSPELWLLDPRLHVPETYIKSMISQQIYPRNAKGSRWAGMLRGLPDHLVPKTGPRPPLEIISGIEDTIVIP